VTEHAQLREREKAGTLDQGGLSPSPADASIAVQEQVAQAQAKWEVGQTTVHLSHLGGKQMLLGKNAF
jgi:hypothetical protein